METWYVLEDGSAIDPADVERNEEGALVAKDGRKVARRSADVYLSRSVDPEDERAARAEAVATAEKNEGERAATAKDKADAKADAAKAKAETTTEGKPGRGYANRAMKTDDPGN